jgi:polar amino acid transport system substrate-binding protein
MLTPRSARTVLAGCTLALLAACGGGNDAAVGSGGSSAPAGGASAGPTVSLVKPGQLTTCTHLPYPPFQFEKVDTPFETIKTGADLNAGKCDIAAAGMTITDERKQNLDFSVPYFDATQALLAKKGSGITSLDTAKGKKMGSQSATTGEDYVKAHGFDPVSFETSDAELNGLKTGQIDVLVQDLPVVSEWLKDPANSGLEIVANLDTGEQYGLGLKKNGNPELLKTVNEVITTAKKDGSYDALYTKWIGQKPTGS